MINVVGDRFMVEKEAHEDLVKQGVFRAVSSKRKQALRKKGVYCFWSSELASYYWIPPYYQFESMKRSKKHI
jgi:hypothetical protein